MQGIRGERGATGMQGYPGHMVYCLELFQIIHIVLSRGLPIFLIVYFNSQLTNTIKTAIFN